MKKIIFIALVAFSGLMIASCSKKDDLVETSGTGYTDLQVYVIDANQVLIEGAMVGLYLSATDRDAGSNPINTGITGSNGFVFFNKIDPTLYFVGATKNTNSVVQSAKGDTGVPIAQGKQSSVTLTLE